MIRFWICFMALFLSFQSMAFLYPEHRKIRADIMLYKYKYCPHDCWSHSFLNQHDAYRCPKTCRVY